MINHPININVRGYNSNVFKFGDAEIPFSLKGIRSRYNNFKVLSEIFFNYESGYTFKFFDVTYYVKKHLLLREGVPILAIIDEKVYYNTDVIWKYKIKELFSESIKLYENSVPLNTKEFLEVYIEPIPKFKFKSIKERLAVFNKIGREVLSRKPFKNENDIF